MNKRDRQLVYTFFRRWLETARMDIGKDLTGPILEDYARTFKIPWVWREEEEEKA